MIFSFRHKGLEQLFLRGDGRKLPPELLGRIRTMLLALDSAVAVEELSLATYRLHSLRGDLKGYWSVTVRANWRIAFRFESGNVYDADFMDYH